MSFLPIIIAPLHALDASNDHTFGGRGMTVGFCSALADADEEESSEDESEDETEKMDLQNESSALRDLLSGNSTAAANE